MKFKKNDKVSNGGDEYIVHDVVQTSAGSSIVLIGPSGQVVAFTSRYVETHFTAKSDPMPGEFYVSSGGSVFMVDNERSIWLVSDRFDGHHKSATNSHRGRWAGSLDYWEKSMGFGPLKKIDIHKFDIKSL